MVCYFNSTRVMGVNHWLQETLAAGLESVVVFGLAFTQDHNVLVEHQFLIGLNIIIHADLKSPAHQGAICRVH